MEPRPAPEWLTTTWFNTPEALDLERLRGQVVVLHAFQMLCPGCVAHGIPQAHAADLHASSRAAAPAASWNCRTSSAPSCAGDFANCLANRATIDT
jgi:hypothetical protein